MDVPGSCRMCAVMCERVVLPAGCVEGPCPRSYSYERGGRRYFGCLERVFRVEIDRAAFDALERERPGFGGLRVSREPLPVCLVEVDRTFSDREGGGCVNPAFLAAGEVRRTSEGDARGRL